MRIELTTILDPLMPPRGDVVFSSVLRKATFVLAISTWMLLFCLGAPATAVFARDGVEIVPIAVWQGQYGRAIDVEGLQDIRKAFPGRRFAHAVDAALIARGGATRERFQRHFSQVADAADDVLMHLAPWKSITGRAGVAFKYAPTAFGAPISDLDCLIDCGLDLSFSAFAINETSSIISSAKKALEEAGFGNPKAVYFDEGIVERRTRSAALGQGLLEDWSGAELAQFKDVIGSLPVYLRNEQNVQDFPVANMKEMTSSGLVLDHVRYGIQSEIGDLDGALKLIKMALSTAKSEGRIVRIPIIFNVEDLVHTKNYVKEALVTANKLAVEAGVPVVDWTVLNTTWDIKKIGSFVASQSLVTQDPSSKPKDLDEAEFVPSNAPVAVDLDAH